MNALWAVIAAIALLAGTFWAGTHFGGEGQALKCAAAEVHTEVQAQTKERHDTVTIAQEAKTYETATDPLTPIDAPVARVCYYSTAPAVPSTHPAGPRIDAALPQRGPDPVSAVPGPDIGSPLVRVGHVNDAKVAGLQDYITHVCQVQQ